MQRKQIKLSTIARKVQRHVDEIKQHRAQCIHPDAVDELEKYMAAWTKRWKKMYIVYGQFSMMEGTYRFRLNAKSQKSAREYIERSYPNFKVEGVV